MTIKDHEIQDLEIKATEVEIEKLLKPIKYTQEELEARKQELTLMSDRLTEMVFADNKNNELIAGILNAARKIHTMPQVDKINRSVVQKSNLKEFHGKKMEADIAAYGQSINIAIEVQKEPQKGYAVRSVLSSGNMQKDEFQEGQGYTQAPDIIGLNILGFRLPELKNTDSFCSRIVRANYDTKEPFLADKYSDYFIELPKMPKTIDEVPKEYRELWEICLAMKTKVKDYDRVVKQMSSSVAIELINEAQKALSDKYAVQEVLSYDDQKKNIMKTLELREARGKAEGIEIGFRLAVESGVADEMLAVMAAKSGISPERAKELINEVKAQQHVPEN